MPWLIVCVWIAGITMFALRVIESGVPATRVYAVVLPVTALLSWAFFSYFPEYSPLKGFIDASR